MRSLLAAADGYGLAFARLPRLTDFRSAEGRAIELKPIAIEDLLVLVVVLALYSAFASVVARWWVTAALFFTVVGWVLGPAGLGWFQSQVASAGVEISRADRARATRISFVMTAVCPVGTARGLRIP